MNRKVSRDKHDLLVGVNMMHYTYDAINMHKSSTVLQNETQNLLDMWFNLYQLLW